MKVAMQSGLKLASNSRFNDAAPTAYSISTTKCEFQLSNGGSLQVCNPKGFAAVRDMVGVDHDSFFASLTRDELTGGETMAVGKSGAEFWFSKDGRFVLKTVPEDELQTLLTILPKYARHLQANQDSLLTRYFGAYRLTPSRGGDVVRIVVMNNVVEGAKSHKLYDLKGTTEDRFVEERKGRCLKDLNFEKFSMYTKSQTNASLQATIESDTRFLESLNIMDYSLLLSVQSLKIDDKPAFHPKPFSKLMGGLAGTLLKETANGKVREACIYHIGFVDLLTAYDLKKKVANVFKSNTIGHFCEIDTEPPDVYAERFRNYLERKILSETVSVKVDAVSREQFTVAPKPAPVPAPVAAPVAAPVPAPVPVDLLTFDNSPKRAAPSAAVGNLMDFDCFGSSPSKAAPALAPTGASMQFDLLSFDGPPLADSSRQSTVTTKSNHGGAMNFDLLA